MKKISTQFAVLLSLAAVVPLLAYGAVSMMSLRTGAREAVRNGNIGVARQVGEQIQLYIVNSVRILNAVAADLQQTRLDRWQQDRILKNYVIEFPEYRELTLLDDAGNPVVSSRLGRPSAEMPGPGSISIGDALVSHFTVDDDLLPSAVVAVRLDDGPDTGWLVGRLNLEELWRMVDRIGVQERGYALVATADDKLIAHGNPDAKALVARGDLFSHPSVLRAAAAAPDGIAWDEYTTELQGDVLGVAVRLPEFGWTVVVEQPVEEAFAIPIALQRQLAVSIALALLAMVTAGYVWGRRFIDPILALTRGTRALAEGRLDERVSVQSNNELGQLAAAFNNMADRLVELQEDVRKKERQAMFGRISLGLVHDLSNPIQNIGNSCQLMMKIWDDLEYRETFKRTIDRELAQIKRVLDDLRNVARPMPLERFPVDINKGIRELVESMQPAAESGGLEIETELVLGPLYIEGDLFALNRVYRNLLINALQATPPRGRVVVRTSRADGQAVVEIADTGCGIPAERLETIFDDFVTTKRRGLGLGLAISKKIVEQLGGTISVTSQVGVGSTFTLRFPLTRARPSQISAVS